MTDHNKLLRIGIDKRNGIINDSWNDLALKHSDGLFTNGEQYRLWVKNRLKIKNTNTTKYEDNLKNNFQEEVEIKTDGTQVSKKLVEMSIEQSKNPEYLLRIHGYDPSHWELTNAKSKIWNGFSDNRGIIQLYASSISVKPKTKGLSLELIRNTFEEIAKNYSRPIYKPIHYEQSGKMLEISIADVHLGKLAWAGDSNDTYNWEIARKRFFHIINDVLTRTQSYKFEKILFCWSNDFFHYDGLSKTTTAGTPQDTDLKFAQMYKIGTTMLIEAIDLLSQFAPVETFYVGANHDKLTSYVAIEHLAAWFRNDPNVKVDTDPKIRKYIEFGKCLIQFTHGHAEGKRIGEVMPIEAREAWGRTIYHEVHAGHYHSEKTVTKDNGVIVRYLNSPTGTDTWHYESAYVGSLKIGQSFIWDKELGLLDIIYSICN